MRVDLHLFRLDEPAGCDQLELQPEEAARAATFVGPIKRARFEKSRKLIRTTLGNYLGIAASEVRLENTEHGKPFLRGDEASLKFSYSHSQNVLALAIHRGDEELGVDLEHVRLDRNWKRLTERFFADAEKAYLGSLPENQGVLEFYRVWTRKEAVLKALGTGINRPLSAFSVVNLSNDGLAIDRQRVVLRGFVDSSAPDFRIALGVVNPRDAVNVRVFSG